MTYLGCLRSLKAAHLRCGSGSEQCQQAREPAKRAIEGLATAHPQEALGVRRVYVPGGEISALGLPLGREAPFCA